MKKQKYQRTTDQLKIREKAAKVRAMTDEQLVHYIEDRVMKAWSEGYNYSKAAEGYGCLQ